MSFRYLEIRSKSKTQKLPVFMLGLPTAMLGGCPGSPVSDLGRSSLPMNFWQLFSPSFKAG